MTDQETAQQAEARVRAEMQREMSELKNSFEAEKQAILGTNSALKEEKTAIKEKFKGLTDEKLTAFEEYQKRLETDEEMRLISEGKVDEVLNRRMQGREKAWNETQSEYEQRLASAQSTADEYKSKVEELENQNLSMRKKQYFKDLVSKDDSFKSEYFEDYFSLQGRNADIDLETGAVYALDTDGKRKVDTDGNFVKYEDDYAKQKINHGLFWSGGAGSGFKAGQGGQGAAGSTDKWDKEQKMQYIRDNGREAYAKLLSQQSKK